jgi:transcriptional regulator with XRE-family HTH domain
MKRPTMKDVARATGVSEATVSYVINNGPRPVQKDTRQKILTAINDLGYRPHAIARSLKKGSTRTVGFLVQSLISPFVSNLVNSIEKNLAKHDYGLILASAHENCEREGKYMQTDLHDRTISVQFEHLKTAKHTCVFSAGTGKARAVYAFLRTGLATELFVDEELAKAILLLYRDEQIKE